MTIPQIATAEFSTQLLRGVLGRDEFNDCVNLQDLTLCHYCSAP